MLAMRTTMAKNVVSSIADAVTYDAQGRTDSSSTRTATSTWSCWALSAGCSSQSARLPLCKIAGMRRLSVVPSHFGVTGLDITSRAATTAEMPICLYRRTWRSGGRPKDCGSTNSVATKSDMVVLCDRRRGKTNTLPVGLLDSCKGTPRCTVSDFAALSAIERKADVGDDKFAHSLQPPPQMLS